MRSMALSGGGLFFLEHFARIFSSVGGLPGHLGGPGFAPKSIKVAIGRINKANKIKLHPKYGVRHTF